MADDWYLYTSDKAISFKVRWICWGFSLIESGVAGAQRKIPCDFFLRDKDISAGNNNFTYTLNLNLIIFLLLSFLLVSLVSLFFLIYLVVYQLIFFWKNHFFPAVHYSHCLFTDTFLATDEYELNFSHSATLQCSCWAS